MANHFQTVVDLDASPEQAAALAVRAVDWLVREGVVLGERADCALGSPLGHPPGPRWSRATVTAVRPPTDGLAVVTGRTVFDGGQGLAAFADCPNCVERTALCTPEGELLLDAWEPFADAIDRWHRTGDAVVRCRHCGRDSNLPAWSWADDYFAFGHLGLEFWNWPRLAPGFLADLSRVLDGHRTVVTSGKL